MDETNVKNDGNQGSLILPERNSTVIVKGGDGFAGIVEQVNKQDQTALVWWQSRRERKWEPLSQLVELIPNAWVLEGASLKKLRAFTKPRQIKASDRSKADLVAAIRTFQWKCAASHLSSNQVDKLASVLRHFDTDEPDLVREGHALLMSFESSEIANVLATGIAIIDSSDPP